MKGRVFWVFALTAALVLAALSWRKSKGPSAPPAGSPVTIHPTAPAPPKTEVAIEDGKTIDFSGGTPVVRDNAKEKAAIARAVREMEEATKNVTFSASAPAADDKKKAEPPVAPPKS